MPEMTFELDFDGLDTESIELPQTEAHSPTTGYITQLAARCHPCGGGCGCGCACGGCGCRNSGDVA